MTSQYKTDVLILGAGIAGLSAAKAVSRDKQVLVVSKGAIREGATHYAQGGIAAAIHKDDAPVYHLEDTLLAGDGLCNRDNVEVLVREGADRVRELIELGAQFNKTNGIFDLAKEGAHGNRRILHAGDATGREIEKTLGNYVSSLSNVSFLEHAMVLDLIVEQGKCVGCRAILKDEIISIFSANTILATGGAGQLYERNTNPPLATGDGLAIAYRAGAQLQDLEFFQFHPTTLYQGDKKPISLFLISEAVRGEGAVLRDSQGDRFMAEFHPLEELAPRDVVSRAIFSVLNRSNASHVYLDLTAVNVDLKSRFPTIYKRCLEAGFDLETDMIPVVPAAHYFMGGVVTDIYAKTCVPHLYAAGEVASLGLHGANRLASNSLLDGLVFGHRAGRACSEDGVCVSHNDNGVVSSHHMDILDPHVHAKILRVKDELRHAMWQHVGIIRNEIGLMAMKTYLQSVDWVMQVEVVHPVVQEVQNMVLVSTLITDSALQRKESRGAHFRSDFSVKQISLQEHHIVQALEFFT